MAEEEDLDELTDPSGPSIAGVILPLGTAAIALVVGALVGGIVVGLWPRTPELVEVPRDLNNTEIEAMCAPKIEEAVAETAESLEEAEGKVRTLEAKVEATAREVDKLEAEMTRRAEGGRKLMAELEAAKKKLVELETALEVALEEKAELQVELEDTKIELAEQIVETHVAKEDALVYKWKTFVSDSQLAICEKGGRRKMGRCRETVAASLDVPRHKAFEHCIRSGQEIPSIREMEKGALLPEFAQFLGEDSRVTEGWYLQLCDPTLPEAEGFTDQDLGRPASGTAEWELDDLDL